MNQDVNKIIDILGGGYAQESLNLRKQLAILAEENDRLKQEIETLKGEVEADNSEQINEGDGE